MNRHTRRKTLAGTATASAVVLAGCSALTGPDPSVTDTHETEGLAGVVSGRGQLYVFVVNDGPTGDVEVTVRFTDAVGNTIDKRSRVVEIERGERRRVDFAVSTTEGIVHYNANTKSAEGLL